MLSDGLAWCGLLWCFYQLFGLSFWRHPFTAEDPLVCRWCNATFLHICPHVETISSPYGLRVRASSANVRFLHHSLIQSYVLNTVISFSRLMSLLFFFFTHFRAKRFPVFLSFTMKTSENAPLEKVKTERWGKVKCAITWDSVLSMDLRESMILVYVMPAWHCPLRAKQVLMKPTMCPFKPCRDLSAALQATRLIRARSACSVTSMWKCPGLWRSEVMCESITISAIHLIR